MKKLKVLFASLLTLCLFACESNTSSSTPAKVSVDDSSTSEVAPASSSAAPKASSSEAPAPASSETPTPTPDSSVDPVPDTSSEDTSSETESSEASSSAEDVGWDADIVADMNQYLNNNVIPYIDLGKGTYSQYHSPSYSDQNAYLAIYGYVDFTDTVKTTFESTYTAAAWTVVLGTDKVTATLASENLTVDLTSDDGGFAMLKASWDEPYDPTSVTAWPDDVQTLFDTYIPDCTIPFIYLGSVNMTPTKYSSDNNIYITGGTWNDDVIANAEDVLGDDWTIGYETDWYGDSIWTARKDFGTYTISITLQETSYGTVEMTVSYLESFNPDTAAGSWSDEVTNAFDAKLDSHALPYFYMGTNSPAIEDYYDGELIMYSMGEWDDEVFTLADAAFNAEEGWTVSTKKSSYYGTYHEYTKDFDDGHTITVDIYDYSDYGYGVTVVAAIKETFSVPDDVTDWTDTINAYWDSDFDGHKVPFFYMGTENPSCYYYDNELEIYTYDGGWDDQIVDLAIAALNADDSVTWTYTKSTDSTGHAKLTATATYEDGHIIVVTVAYQYWYDSAYITIEMKDTFDPTSCSDWTDATKTLMGDNLDGHVVPYVYLGSTDPTAEQYGARFEVTGGDYNAQILTLAETAFADWDFETIAAGDYNGGYNFTEGSDMFKATKTFDDGDTLIVCIGKSYYGESYMEVLLDKAYVVDETVTEFGTAYDTIMASQCDGCDIPFFYMGTSSVSTYDYSYYGYFYVYAGSDVAYSSGMVDAFEAALAADTGWTYTETTDSYGFRKVTASKNFDNGTKLTVVFSYNSYYGPTMQVTPGTVYVIPDTATDWSDDVKATMTSRLGTETIPFFYVGSEEPEVYDSTYYGYASLYSNATWDEQIITEATNALNADGDWTIVTVTDSYGYTSLRATKDLGNGTCIWLVVKYSSYYGCYMQFGKSNTYSLPEDAVAWGDDFNEACTDYLDNHEIPYVYLGTLTEDVDTYYFDYYGEIDVYGGSSYSDQLFLDAKETLEDEGWTCTLAYGTDTYYSLTATFTYDDGCTITLKICYSTYNGVYMEIYYTAA